MAGTGLATQLTIGEEPSYGTIPASITRAFEIRSESLEDAIERIESESLRAGKRLQSFWRPNRKGGEGDIEFEVQNKNFGLLFKHMFGAIAITTPGGGTLTRDHTATMGNLNGKSLGIQVGRPDVGGTVNAFTHYGCKVSEFELAAEVDALLLLTLTLDVQDIRTPASVVPGPALATPVYPSTPELFDFQQIKLQVAGADVDLTTATFSGGNNLKTDRYFLRRSALKKEQIEDTAPREYGVELGGEFEGLTAYNRFVNGTEASLLISTQGSLIEGALNFGVDVTFPRVRWDGGTPTAGGPDVLEMPQTVKVLQPAAGEAVTVLYRTTDTVS